MEIGGSDMIIKGKSLTKEKIVEVIRTFWKDLVVEHDNEFDFFVYKNQAAKDAWDLDCGEQNDLIYVLPRKNELTLVIDDKKVNLPIVEAIKSCT